MARIGGSQAEVVLDSKSNFQQAPLVRLVATTGLLEEQSWIGLDWIGLQLGKTRLGYV